MPRKKVVFVIVEGINDQTALQLVLGRLLRSENVVFELVRGDITTKYDHQPCNMKAKVQEHVVTHMKREKTFTKDDIQEIVQLVDLDGAFVPDERILEDVDALLPVYGTDSIRTAAVVKMKDRNTQKKMNLAVLIGMKNLSVNERQVPYSIYYFSRNFEHAMMNLPQTLTMAEKDMHAEQFAEKYAENQEEFLSLLSSRDVAVPLDYKESWQYVQQDCHSLARGSNFWIFFSPRAPHIERCLISPVDSNNRE